jgi:glucose-6-phosphate 1-dehydrogenase
MGCILGFVTQLRWHGKSSPLLHWIYEGKLKVSPYKQGSQGPKEEVDELLNVKADYVQTERYIEIPPSLKV